METYKINNNILEYEDESHTYIIDGIVVPSITQFMKEVLANDYKGVPEYIMKRASKLGTEMHESIEKYEKFGITSDSKEFRNYKFLKDHFNFNVIKSEIPVILYEAGVPIMAGRLDQIIEINGKLAVNDLKRVSALNKGKVATQVNLYRIAYQQSYNQNIEALYVTHLREDVRKFIELPINEEYIKEIITKWKTH